MKHYVLLLKESEVSIGTYISVHFYKDAEFEDMPILPPYTVNETEFSWLTSELEKQEWKKTIDPGPLTNFPFSIQEFVLNDFRALTVFYFNGTGRLIKLKRYLLVKIEEEIIYG